MDTKPPVCIRKSEGQDYSHQPGGRLAAAPGMAVPGMVEGSRPAGFNILGGIRRGNISLGPRLSPLKTPVFRGESLGPRLGEHQDRTWVHAGR